MILFLLFYGAYFGIIIGAWVNTEAAAEAAPVLPTAAAIEVNTATVGHSYITRLAGQKYHTRRNCGQIIGRDQKKFDKCLD